MNRDLLIKYSCWLEENGYLDSDWYQENPSSVKRFLEEYKEIDCETCENKGISCHICIHNRYDFDDRYMEKS